LQKGSTLAFLQKIALNLGRSDEVVRDFALRVEDFVAERLDTALELLDLALEQDLLLFELVVPELGIRCCSLGCALVLDCRCARRALRIETCCCCIVIIFSN